MAHTFSRQVLQNGSRNYVLKYTAVCDGATGELAGSIVNATTGDMGTANAIEEISVECSGCSANLVFDATTDVPFLTCGDGGVVSKCYDPALVNNAGSGKTGDIQINTVGFTTAGDAVSIFVKVKKK